MSERRTIPWYVPHVVFILAGIIIFGIAFYLVGQTKEEATKLWADIIKDFGVVIMALAVTDIVWKFVGGDPITGEIAQLRDRLSQQIAPSHDVKYDISGRDEGRIKIEGEYHTGDSIHYRIVITHLSGNYYRVENPEWEGVGLFDGDFFYTVFRMNDNSAYADRRGNWGTHRAKFRLRDKSFEVFGTEIKEESHFNDLRGRWVKKTNV